MTSIGSLYRVHALRLSCRPLASCSLDSWSLREENCLLLLTHNNKQLKQEQCWRYFHTSSSIRQQQQQSGPSIQPELSKQSSAVSNSGINPWLRYIPSRWIPYAQLARIDKPIGTLLLLYPCLWSSALASHTLILTRPLPSSVVDSSLNQTHILNTDLFMTVAGDPYLIALFTAGAFIMRGAGCTINDMWDAKYDKLVARTQDRPLASGVLSLFPHATLFLGAQLMSGLAILSSFPSQHLPFCFLVGMSSMPLVILYPLMKRFTNWPQLVLGLTFNWGAWMGWAAVHGSFSSGLASGVDGLSVIVPLYAGSVAWTLVYDTLYAHQDKVDDEKLGLKSTALYFGKDDVRQRWILSSFSLVAGGCWIMSGYQLGIDMDRLMMHPVCSLYYVGCLGAMGHLLWQVNTAKFDDVKNLSHRFRSNSVVGAIMLGSCVMSNVGLLL